MRVKRRGKRRWGGWQGAALLGIGLGLVVVLARVSFLWHERYSQTVLAISAIGAASRTASAPLRHHLLGMAASLLGAPKVRRSNVLLNQVAVDHLHRLAQNQWFVSPAAWTIAFVVIVAAIYWMREGHIAWLEAEHALLKEQLLAIARGWASLATDPNPRDVMQNILTEVAQHTAVGSAAIYRLTENRANSLALYAAFGSLLLSEDPIPRIFIGSDAGLIGQALKDNAARYSGDLGEGGYLIPGVRIARVGVFPLIYQNTPWGVLLLTSHESDWYYTYRDLLDVLAQEIAIAASTAELAEEARRNRLMEERARMQSEILANVSHELRTPLGLVKGYLETLDKSWERMSAHDRREFLEVAVSETHELEELIDHLLLMSRVDSAEVPFEPTAFALGVWFQGALERYTVWDQERIVVHQMPPQDTLVYGDPRELTTALSDLLQNALKYSKGLVQVEFHVSAEDWTVSVRDWGPGVPPAEMEKIFERFYRVPVHAQSEIRGSGLGLSIVKRIVGLHGGRLEAANAPGGGFQVAMQLPMEGCSRREREDNGAPHQGQREMR